VPNINTTALARHSARFMERAPSVSSGLAAQSVGRLQSSDWERTPAGSRLFILQCDGRLLHPKPGMNSKSLVQAAGAQDQNELQALTKAATSVVPILIITSSDPVKSGLVASLNRPVGNVTGLMTATSILEAKKYVLLSEMVPKAQTFAMLINPD
jgi:hypothetical protein